MTLRLDWVGNEAIVLSCRRWHYSHSVPAGRKMALGVWEDDSFRGVIVFSRGATKMIGRPYDLEQDKICELTRVALRSHVAPVSRMISIAVRMLTKNAPGLELIVSYAALEEGHLGGIYQAGNWIYVGPVDSYALMLNGKRTHARTVSSKYGRADVEWLREHVDPKAERIVGLIRHKYLMPLTDEIREKILPLRQPYPKRVKQAMAGDQPEQRQCGADPHAPQMKTAPVGAAPLATVHP